MKQLKPDQEALMRKQHYELVGSHSAVKVCGWTKNMLTGRGGCYKLKFYGIMSHRCLQMTSSISCANRCVFCWRDYKAPVSREWNWSVDDPEWIIEESIEAQRRLLSGFGGNPKTPEALWKQALEPRHVALSLTGEPIQYPRINDLIDGFHRRGISTFLVTNAQFPEKIRELRIVTQLYISADAPTPEMLKRIDKPLFPDYWERFMESLEEMSKKKFRTAIRITAIKGMNMGMPEEWAKIVKRARPDFVEVKAYMFVGASRERLEIGNMPRHPEVREFAAEILKHLPDYEIVSEHAPSRVVLLARKSLGRKTWIDFRKFFELLREKDPDEIATEDYLADTGKGNVEEEKEEMELD